jgi:DegV family protein with EDD domain
MDLAGKSVDEIVQHLEVIREKVLIILTLDTLEYARRSGRVGTLSAALASLLNVKPIARLEDGVLNMVEKVRTRKAALDRVLEMGKEAYGNQSVHVGVVHARDPESAASLTEEAKKHFNYKDIVQSDLSVSLAINLYPTRSQIAPFYSVGSAICDRGYYSTRYGRTCAVPCRVSEDV